MPIKVVPHSDQHVEAVHEFNQRMLAGGSKWGFYTDPQPDWIPPSPGAPTWREYHLAVEDERIVRGGYALKPQTWLINGAKCVVTDWQGPFSEADVDVKYSPLMLSLLRGMLKKYPLLFSLGHGGTEEPIVNMLRKMKWGLRGIPFVFNICHPFAFLRRNRYLRTSPIRRLALDVLAFTGAGFVAIKALQALHKIRFRAAKVPLTAEVVSEFGPWADSLWEQNKDAYTCLAVRDRDMMNTLMPQEGWPGGTRLKFTSASGEVAGWAIVHDKQLTDDARFGSMHVGLITDFFGAPDDAASIMTATHAYLVSQKVDMIFANISHPAWIKGLQSNGYTVLADRRIFALSPQLDEALSPKSTIAQGLHLTNMDGHGPHGFQ
ncbi:MAG: hypothetical protein NXH95_00425 [Pseudomonadaceae bacterium]|nr:hypothetical protein [Pseudomonadaceae bacterium]